MGALAEEDREAEIVTWVGAVLDRNKERIRSRISELVARSNRGLALSTTENRKRSLEETNFSEGGYEMGASLPPRLRPKKIADHSYVSSTRV